MVAVRIPIRDIGGKFGRHETDFNNAGDACEYKGVSEGSVDFGGNHERLSVFGHCPPC
jgi:hypothetical protein